MSDSKPIHALPSYRPSDCCPSGHCDAESTPEQPCWGEVKVVDEIYTEDDYWFVHACEGHVGVMTALGGKYVPESPRR